MQMISKLASVNVTDEIYILKLHADVVGIPDDPFANQTFELFVGK